MELIANPQLGRLASRVLESRELSSDKWKLSKLPSSPRPSETLGSEADETKHPVLTHTSWRRSQFLELKG